MFALINSLVVKFQSIETRMSYLGHKALIFRTGIQSSNCFTVCPHEPESNVEFTCDFIEIILSFEVHMVDSPQLAILILK